MKAIVVFGSTTGNTEVLAEAVAEGLKVAGCEVLVRDASQANPSELKEHELVVLGSSTWGDGELQDDMDDFVRSFGSLAFEATPAAVFGAGDTSYDRFCEAVVTLSEELTARGARLVVEPFKVDGSVDRQLGNAAAWAASIVTAAQS